MNDRQRKALELMTADLKPNEKIFVFGPGGEKNTNKVSAFKNLLGFGVFALVSLTTSLLVSPPEIKMLMAIPSLLLIPYALWVVTAELANDTISGDSFYALTNHRLLVIDSGAVKTVTTRAAIKKMHATERKISLDLGPRALLITKLNLTETT